MIRLCIDLDKVNKKRIVNGQIVWEGKAYSKEASMGLGIKFIKFDDIYKNLMGKT